MPKKATKKTVKPAKRSFGTIRLMRSGNYQASYPDPLGRRTAKGHVVQHYAPSTFVDYEHASTWLSDERRLISEGRWTAPAERLAAAQAAAEPDCGPTVAEYSERLIRRKLKNKVAAPSTADLYRKAFRLRITGTPLASLPIEAVTKADVATWWDDLPDTPTLNWHAYSWLKTMMIEALEEDELIEVNPCRLKLKKPKPKHKGETLTERELLDYLAAVPERYRLPLMVAALCAMRSGEVRGMRRCDVNLAARIIDVEQAVSRVELSEEEDSGYGWRYDDPKTGAGIRSVAMPQYMVEPMRQHLAALPLRGREQILFPALDGVSPIASSVLWEAHDKARRSIKRPTLWVHDLRKTGATMAAQQGATVKELMALLGHTTPDMAMRYQVATKERDRQRADRLDEALSRAI